MATNPYQSPEEPSSGNRSRAWKRVCLAGIAGAALGQVGLFLAFVANEYAYNTESPLATSDIWGLDIWGLIAWAFISVFVLGVIGFVIGGIGWLVTRR